MASSSDVECFSDSGATTDPLQILTPPPSQSSGSTSPVPNDNEGEIIQAVNKKKKKKKSKKSAKAKEAAAKSPADAVSQDTQPPPLCISRNKHWKYISSFHGPWLQLPVELLEYLLVHNLDPAMLTGPDARLPQIPYSRSSNHLPRPRDRGFASLSDHTPPDSPRTTFASLPPPPPFPTPPPGKATPPHIDPGIFRSVTSIRRLIDEASELSVRASSGLSAAALGSMRGGGPGVNSSPWATAQSLGMNPMGDPNGGRNVAMSAMRVHRLRALAVQKLAAAYKADEIASSVMVMQGGSIFDDIAERVLKHDPNDIDAKYVHFFHEKIPSRHLAESTTTRVLDDLIAAQPQRLELFRTRGIVHCFRDEYALAAKDFTHALKEARAQRKAKFMHRPNGNLSQDSARNKGSSKKKKQKGEANGQMSSGTCAPADSQPGNPSPSIEGPDGEPLLLHPSVLPEAPDPIEPQCLFFRGVAYLQHAVFLIEAAVLKLEGVQKVTLPDGAERRLCYLEHAKYGGVEIGNPDGPLGKKDGAKLQAYRQVLNDEIFKENIMNLVKKSIRDHEKFLAHFDTLEGPPYPGLIDGDLAQRTEYAFNLSESFRPGGYHLNSLSSGCQNFVLPEAQTTFTTYHPLLVEAHFSRLISVLILGDFSNLLPMFTRTATIVDGLDGYPVFLPPRSMAQAEFTEVLERLAGGWRVGIQPNSCSRKRITATGYVPSAKSNGKEKQVEELDFLDTYSDDGNSNSFLSSTPPTFPNAASSSASSSALSSPPMTPTNSRQMGGRDGLDPGDIALMQALDNLRILLAPVAKRQKEKLEREGREEVGGGKKKKGISINIPLHGPRVEIVLAWLAAVHLVELERVAV